MLANRRPQNLDNIVGQDKVVKALKNFIKDDTLPNVIFFIGDSGTGKTSLINILCSTLLCENPSIENGIKIPCGKCGACTDIISESFNKISFYSGSELNADSLRELEETLAYSSILVNKKIIVFSELQQSSVITRILEIIEQPRKDTYFFVSSTDSSKFSNIGGKTNKQKEQQALRSRATYFNLKPIATKIIEDYLFNLVQEFDPTETKIPEVFIEEGINTIAVNSFNNLRMGVNDFFTCINSECYTNKEIVSLLGYQDTTNYMNYLLQLCSNNNTVLNDIHELGEDTYGFFIYCWKVLTEIQLRHILGKPFDEEYKEKNYLQLIKLPEFKSVYKMFMVLGKEVGGNYYNGSFNNVLLGSLMELMTKPPEGVKRKVLPENK